MNGETWPTECPNCGEPLPHEALYCRECGASEQNGWSEPWDEEDERREYEDFLAREFPQHAARESLTARQLGFVVVVLLLILIMLLLAVGWPM